MLLDETQLRCRTIWQKEVVILNILNSTSVPNSYRQFRFCTFHLQLNTETVELLQTFTPYLNVSLFIKSKLNLKFKVQLIFLFKVYFENDPLVLSGGVWLREVLTCVLSPPVEYASAQILYFSILVMRFVMECLCMVISILVLQIT